jgi:3-oxoacyl-[acyl-carrier protein] reductase
MDDLSGKVALVTGASRGIGRAIALELARAGADIVVHYRTRVEQAREVEAAVRSFGREARLVQAETHSPRNAVRLAKEAGQVDILINHVGIARPLPFHEVAETEWRELIFENAKLLSLAHQSIAAGHAHPELGAYRQSLFDGRCSGLGVSPHNYAAAKQAGWRTKESPSTLIEPSPVRAGPFGAADEVAAIAVVLARNGHITGQAVTVRGGWYAG